MAVSFEIKQEIGIIVNGKWNTELNLVSWNNATPKYDIRDWNDDHTKMGKGITMTKDELSALKLLLNSIEEI